MRKILFITITLFSFAVKSQVTNGLVFHLDARDTNSYSGSGNTWNDLSGNSYNGTLMNSPSFSNDNGGMINLNGSTQWVQLNSFAGGVI